MTMKTLFRISVILLFALTLFVGAVSAEEITLATTTSTVDTGMLDYLIPIFKEDTGIDLKYIYAGTGKALEYARNGDADVVMVHAKSLEMKFIEEGFGLDRKEVMYNNFYIIGPETDPAGIKDLEKASEAFSLISETESTFISRGDNSGTHVKELLIWDDAGITPSGEWYIEAAAGIGPTLLMANEKDGYALADNSTYLAYTFDDKIDLAIMVQGDPILFNQYSVITVNPETIDTVNYEGAKVFLDWITSERGQQLIADYKKFDTQLFYPNAE
jgi:tungstate transport system substrate-binding protein